MTFLELCQQTGTDSGLISYQNIPTTVVGATGRWAGIISFVNQAWGDVQRARQDWEFMRGSFEHALAIGQSKYLPADLGITDLARFIGDAPEADYQPMHCYDPAIGLDDDASLTEITPEHFTMVYFRGTQTPTKPTEYSLANGALYVGSVPDKAYTLAGSYMKAPQSLVADADTPSLPEHFHQVIKWKAIMKISGKDGAFADRSVAQAEYSTSFRQLVNEQTRGLDLGAALA